MPRGLLIGLVLARDVLQSALLAVGVFALVAVVSARFAAVLPRLAAAVLALVILGNHVSFMQLGTFASSEVLATAWGWVRLHPQSLNNYCTPGAAAVLVLCCLGVLLPQWMVRVARTPGVISRLNQWLPRVVLTLILFGLVGTPLAAARFGERAFPVHGYWAQVASAALSGDATTPLALKIPPQTELRAQYERFAFYPSPPAAKPQWLHPELEPRVRPRHVIVVGLETAPRAFYPLTTADDLPTFVQMRQHALVSEHHYTTSPYTRIANFSMLSGLYAPSSGLPVRFGRIDTDGFAAVLRTRGYETSYVDSWVLDWLPGTGERAQAQMLGFDTVIDSAVHRDDGVYEVLLKAEEVAFAAAFTRIVRAQEHGHKAAVFIGTMLGHGPWPAPEGKDSLDGAERLHNIALVFDRLFGRLLEQLAQRGLAEDVIIVVAGDHGLRYAEEFESLGRSYSHSDLSFNVPFLLYAPGLIDAPVQLSYPTSHIDISPTLLHLLGVPTDGLLHDGDYMLDARLNDRILFLSNSRLGPLDGLHYRNMHFTNHALSGVAEFGDSSDPPRMSRLSDALAPTLPLPLRDPAALLARFDEHANLVAGRLLQRGALLQKTK
ncbi:MAG TPA: sulfatase-like hydrolase/transferase [Polyangiales bacterium]|nr:sulfatase-like hydrolase/transferase [Polyangiales bacterium]